jgi:dihydropteroate synthase
MAGNGAYIIDIGGESTRPGAKVVWEGDEIERVVPVIEALAGQGHIISVDTRKAAVMRAALDAGAAIVNDVSALGYDEEATDVVAESNCPVVLMHAQGDPATMQNNPSYDDALLDIFDWLESKIEKCEQAGIARDRIMIDPGIGFGKSVRHNLELTNGLSLFHALGCPVLFGASRKRFIGALAGVEEAEERLPGSLAAAQMALDRGAQVIRVHDVAESRQLLNIWQGARDASQMPPNL